MTLICQEGGVNPSIKSTTCDLGNVQTLGTHYKGGVIPSIKSTACHSGIVLQERESDGGRLDVETAVEVGVETRHCRRNRVEKGDWVINERR